MKPEQIKLTREFLHKVLDDPQAFASEPDRRSCLGAIMRALGVTRRVQNGREILIPIGTEIKSTFGQKPDYTDIAVTWEDLISGEVKA